MVIPVTVFTGFLGSGKTTIIRNLVQDLPQEYEIVWLKNEFGDIAVDSLLAKEDNIQTQEMLNGCLCCVLVGKLKNALQELVSKYEPQRIIIETSGSAYPEPIALEINAMPELKLDGIVTVVDAENFLGYKDTSLTAKLQAEHTDLILLNKVELVDEQKLDKVLDSVYELNPTTPKVRTVKGRIAADLIFGLDSRMLNLSENSPTHNHDFEHQQKEVELVELKIDKSFEQSTFEDLLNSLPRMDFYRIKGIVDLGGKYKILNYVFGRWDWEELTTYAGITQITFMGKNLKAHQRKIATELGITGEELSLIL